MCCSERTNTRPFLSCGHSFHTACLHPRADRCYICQQGILSAVTKKATIASDAIFNPDAHLAQGHDSDDDEDENDSDGDGEQLDGENVGEITEAQAAAEVNYLELQVANFQQVQLL